MGRRAARYAAAAAAAVAGASSGFWLLLGDVLPLTTLVGVAVALLGHGLLLSWARRARRPSRDDNLEGDLVGILSRSEDS